MAITFPASPSDGDVFTNTTTGVKYIWNDSDGVWKTHVWPTNTDYLQLSGGTLTGDLSLGTNDLTAQDINSTTLTTTGGVTVGNGLTVSDGNVVMADGHGIDFSANAHATGMTSELLDDYEEGEWTPEYTCSTTAPTISYNVQAGTYTKVGNLVTVGWRIRTAGPIASAGAGDVYVTNLPFVIGDTDFDQRGVALVWSGQWDPGHNPNSAMGRKNEDNIQLTLQTSTNSSPTTDLGGNFDNITATAFDTTSGSHNQSYCTITYWVD